MTQAQPDLFPARRDSHFEFPVDDSLGAVMGCLDAESVLETCREQLRAVDAAVRQGWRQGRIIEALYHPGRYIRIAYAFVADPKTPVHRAWPAGDVVYLRAPLRLSMSARGTVLTLNGTKVEAYCFPEDRRLRGLRRFTGRESAITLWQRWLDKGDTDEELDPRSLQRILLRYVPEQKWVARLRAEATQRASGKMRKRRITVRSASPSVCATLLNRYTHLRRLSQASHTRFHASKVVGHEISLGLLAVKWTHGKSLLETLQEGAPAREVMRGMASVLRSLHTSAIPDLRRVTLQEHRLQVQHAVEDLSATCPNLRSRMAELASALHDRLRATASSSATRDPVTLHNDLHAQQVRIEAERFTFLDLERMALGDPLIDVANLATQVRMLGHRPRFSAAAPGLAVDVNTAQRWAGEFLEAWEQLTGETIDAARFRVYVVLSLLNLARGMMRHLRPGWRALADRCVELAEVELALTGREVTSP